MTGPGRRALRAASPRTQAIVVVAALLALWPAKPSSALSCAPPVLDEGRMAEAVVIFEGSAGRPRSLTRLERWAFEISGATSAIGGATTIEVFPFTVLMAWKGVSEGQRVEVLYNTYWGDSFVEPGPYLVVSPLRILDLYWAPLCGNTTHVDGARLTGDIARLERFIGIGHHLRVKSADRACVRDEECTVIQTHCGACSCGTPVAKSEVTRLQDQFDQTCAVIGEIEICERHCPAPVVRCDSGLCVAQ